jgi:hypothetical protein
MIYFTLSSLSTKSHLEWRILVTKTPNIQGTFCVEIYKILRLQRITIRKQDRQIVYGETFWLVREIYHIFV